MALPTDPFLSIFKGAGGLAEVWKAAASLARWGRGSGSRSVAISSLLKTEASSREAPSGQTRATGRVFPDSFPISMLRRSAQRLAIPSTCDPRIPTKLGEIAVRQAGVLLESLSITRAGQTATWSTCSLSGSSCPEQPRTVTRTGRRPELPASLDAPSPNVSHGASRFGGCHLEL